jgi:hypothetical protein
LEIYNSIVKLQKGDGDDEKLQVGIFAIQYLSSVRHHNVVKLLSDRILPLFTGAG